MDQYYLVDGKVLSTFREIEKVVEKSRIEVLVSAKSLENVMSLSIPRKGGHSFCESINENRGYRSNKEPMKANRSHSSTENKKICVMKYVQRKMDSTLRIRNDSLYHIISQQNHIKRDNIHFQEGAISESIRYNELSDKKLSAFDRLQDNGFDCGKNFWLRIFYYFQNKFRSPSEKHDYIKHILEDYPNVHERLKHFGFSLLLVENEMVDTYGFRLLQQIYENKKMDFEKTKVRNKMAMEFVNSHFAETIVIACNENSCHFSRSRMKYTDDFEYVQFKI